MGAVRFALAVLGAIPVWVAGTVFFDGVHWVLHGFLRAMGHVKASDRAIAEAGAWLKRVLA